MTVTGDSPRSIQLDVRGEAGRVLVEAALVDAEGPVLVTHGSARLADTASAAAQRSAVNLATGRALRRLAEVTLRSAHETSDAVRVRATPAPPAAALRGVGVRSA